MILPRIIKRVKPWLAAGATSRRIHAAIPQAFSLSASAYSITQLRYDLRKLKAHELLERQERSYAYRLTDKGIKAAAMFVSDWTG